MLRCAPIASEVTPVDATLAGDTNELEGTELIPAIDRSPEVSGENRDNGEATVMAAIGLRRTANHKRWRRVGDFSLKT